MMKAKLHLLLMLLLCSIGAAASPDSLRRLELFIDSDPGVGNGTQYTIATQRDTFIGSGITMAVPSTIKPGWHTLYIRSFADSFGYRGRWSQAAGRQFFVPVLIVAAEYFIDTDPGAGNGISIPVSTPDDTVSLTNSISTTGLSAGLHTVYVRTKDNLGKWSTAQARNFYVTDVVVAGEYFFNTDPGAGNGTAFTFSPTDDTVNKSLSVATPSNLADGKHILYVRTRTAGKWSLPQARDFHVLPRINAAEYFFDHDPGVGNGTPLAISTPSDSINNASYSIGTGALSGGMHRLYVRTRSVSGRWSIAQERSFFVRPKIVAAEYFWDTDPGTGNGIALSITQQSDTLTSSYSIKAPCVMPGTHFLYIRTKDEAGRWGITGHDTVTFSNPSVVATAAYPGPGPYGTPVKVKGSGGMAPYTYKMGTATASADSIFLAANNTSVSFTAIDTCGYSGTTTITTPATPTIIAGGSTGSGTLTLNSYRYWTYVLDANGHIIGAVRDNRQNLGTVTMDYLKNNSGTVRTFPFASVKYLDRNWYVNTSVFPSSNVGVQLFAVDSEFNALQAMDASLTSKSDLRVTKYEGANEDLDISNNSGDYVQFTPDSVVTFTGASSSGNGYALAFSVASFSEFYQSRNTAVALPLQSVMLQAVKHGNAVQLQWHTEGEKATRRHILSRGTSAKSMESIARMLPGPGTDNDYSYLDEAPLKGINHYRVAVEGADGSVYHSQIVVVRMDNNRTLAISPNPAHDVLRISGLEAGDDITLNDMAGRAVWHGAADGGELRIHTAGYAAGMYMLVVKAAGNRTVQRIEIVH